MLSKAKHLAILRAKPGAGREGINRGWGQVLD